MLVETYFQKILRPQLHLLGLQRKQQDLICSDIRGRLVSLMGNWHDTKFRKTALLLGREDAKFYQPASVALEIRALVAVGVRNSMLEDLTAAHSYVRALQPVAGCLPDSFVPSITSKAISFFASAWHTLGGWHVAQPTARDDIFRTLAQRFPRAWQRLELLATSPKQEQDIQDDATGQFQPVQFDDPDIEATAKVTVLSGYAPTIDPDLRHMLEVLRQGEVEFFYTNSFKWLTRNPEKLLRVIESLISWNRTYVTNNYVIRHNYCARRQPLIRPGHTTADVARRFANEAGLVERHRIILRNIRQMHGEPGE